MTALEIELLAGLRACFASLKVYERERTAFHLEMERIIEYGTLAESKTQR